MATRLTGTFVDRDQNYEYVINIDDSDFVATSTPMSVTNVFFSWKPEREEIFNPILSSSLTFSIVVDSAAIENVIDDIINSPEGEFRIKVERDGVIYWVGYVLTDRITKEDARYPFLFQIQADDGLSRLKSINYANGGAVYTGKDTLLDHIGKVLSKIELDDFYASGDDYLVTCVDLIESDYAGVAASAYDPLDYNRFKHSALNTIDTNGRRNFMSSYDVLEDIMTAIGARFMYSEGAYRVTSLWNYHASGDSHIRTYTKDVSSFTYSNSTNLATWTNELGDPEEYKTTYDLVKSAGGVNKWYPPIYKAQLDYNHQQARNLLQGYDGSAFTVEDIDNFFGSTFWFSETIQYSGTFVNFSLYSHYYLKWAITIQIGTRYLKRDITISTGSGVQIGDVSWAASTADYEVVKDAPTASSFQGNFPITISTPALPTSGDLTFNIEFQGIFKPDGTALTETTDYTFTWEAPDPILEIVYTGSFEDQSNTLEYTAENNNSGNSRELNVETIIGTGPSLTASGAIESRTGGGTWALSTGHRYDTSTSYKDLGQLVVNQMVAFQSKPVNRLLIPVIGLIEAHDKLKVTVAAGTSYYIFNGGKFDPKNNIWDGEWFKIAYEAADISELTPEPVFGDDATNSFKREGGFTKTDGPFTPTIEGDLNAIKSLAPASTGAALTAVATTTITLDATKPDRYWYDNDEIRLIDSTGYLEDRPVVNGDHSSGTSLTVDSFTPVQIIRNGAKIMFDPEFFYTRFSVNRRKQYSFHLIDSTTNLSVTTPPQFFRPMNWMVNVRMIKWGVSVYAAGSVDTAVTVVLKRGAGGTTVGTINISGAVTDAEQDPSHTIVNDVYWWDITAASATTMPQGLQAWIELVY